MVSSIKIIVYINPDIGEIVIKTIWYLNKSIIKTTYI